MPSIKLPITATGMNLNLFEVMFVKLKASQLDLGVSSAVEADQTSQWMDQAVRGHVCVS